MGEIAFNVNEKDNLTKCITSVINCNKKNVKSSFESFNSIEFVKRTECSIIKLISKLMLLPIDIYNIVYEYSHDVITIDFNINYKDLEFIVKLQNQFELLITVDPNNKHVETFLLYVSDDIMTYNLCRNIKKFNSKRKNTKVTHYNELTRFNNSLQSIDSMICKFDKFMNAYMKRYYNKNNYIDDTQISTYNVKCSYENEVFIQHIDVSNIHKIESNYERGVLEILFTKAMLIMKPTNHKLIKQMIVIVKLFHNVIQSVLKN